MTKKFKFWCKGTSTNPNFNRPGWWTFNNVILRKYYGGMDIFESPDFEVCQWTGLVDKNGVYIYEGDIVALRLKEHHNGVRRCVETVDMSEILNRTLDMESIQDEYKYMEIIGNKFENPELLCK